MNEREAAELLDKYNKGVASPSEKAIVQHWYLMESAVQNSGTDHLDYTHLKSKMWKNISTTTGIDHTKAKTFRLWPRIAAAMLLLITLGTLAYLYQDTPENRQKTWQKQIAKSGIKSGGNNAVLILADGSRISLNDANNGKITNQAGVDIVKTADGKLVYTVAKTTPGSAASNALNTIETPRGGQYQINLPDGTTVWLNAASSLRFPITFSKTERRVELTGEAYFEVARNEHLPFRVVSNKQTVEVLGTHFNVNSYTDEPIIKTTLLEGSVKVLTEGTSKVIKPGQQAEVSDSKSSLKVKNIDAQEVISWKNNVFHFENADIKNIMRQMERWYNIDVEYSGDIPDRIYEGELSRKANLDEVLKMLSYAGINFRITGKTIVVTP
ncbi:FecR family protein [Pedobacter frigoris]|uniref:FecR family protein n=1 Tax=Pedobacter frigoris TaxID=2571272 RepID=UPI00292CB933|nr:FecR domain-containing protein [Pedobacter frigoris]